MRQVFLDTETTGLNAAQGDRIIEFACVEFVNRRNSGRQLHRYVNPERSSHPDALRVHGITDEFLADKPLFAAVAQELIDFVAGADVVIHNAAFDVAFLNAELSRLNLPPFGEHVAKVTDSLLLAREQFPGKANSLDALCKRLEVDNSHRDLHGALVDADLLAEVYLRLTRGQGSLVIDTGDGAAAKGAGPAAQQAGSDLSAYALPVLRASAAELAAHAAVMAELDNASKGKLVWRETAGTAATVASL
jgi:DNA polymerase III subunit epsilon